MGALNVGHSVVVSNQDVVISSIYTMVLQES